MSRALWKQVQRGPGTVVDFADVAPFAWDRLYVFHPYTPHEQIHESLGFHWPDVRDTTIKSYDFANLVVFVKNGKVVYWFEHLRGRGDLADLANPQGYSREEARFEVRSVGSEQWLTLAKRQK